MKLLEDYISEKGRLVGKDIVKVDSFLNHQVDPLLMQAMGKEIKRLFADTEITKILTIEASGIAIAVMAALERNVPMVFAKKNATKKEICLAIPLRLTLSVFSNNALGKVLG